MRNEEMNYSTNAIRLWLINEESANKYWNAAAEEAIQSAIDSESADIRKEAVEALQEALQEDITGDNPLRGDNSVYSDLLQGALSDVDWYALAHVFIDDIKLFGAGWNMSGYMPDMEPALFLSFEAAKEYVAEEIKRDAENEAEMAKTGGDESATPEHDAALLSLANEHGEFSGIVGKYCYWVKKG